jgi:hypothetical protein
MGHLVDVGTSKCPDGYYSPDSHYFGVVPGIANRDSDQALGLSSPSLPHFDFLEQQLC